MTIVSRRLVPFAAIIAVAATLAVWMTVGAAAPRGGGPSALTTLHFTNVNTSQHISLNGATDKQPAGATVQSTGNIMASGRQVGSAFVNGTFINNAGWGLFNIELRFPGRGRLELQGAKGPSGNTSTFAIIGGTGVFTTARGWVVKSKSNIIITFR
jgi:hypothetical protein